MFRFVPKMVGSVGVFLFRIFFSFRGTKKIASDGRRPSLAAVAQAEATADPNQMRLFFGPGGSLRAELPPKKTAEGGAEIGTSRERGTNATSGPTNTKVPAIRIYMLEVLQKHGGNLSAAEREIKETSFHGSVDRRSLRRWRDAGDRERRHSGKPVNSEFEADVVSCMIFAIVREIDHKAKTELLGTVAYSYANIRTAAVHVQKSLKWYDDAQIEKLQFSNMWISRTSRTTQAAHHHGREEKAIS